MDVEHLWCKVCEEDIAVAIVDGELKLVCDCALNTDRIVPNDPDSLFTPVMPYGWNFVEREGEADE